MPRTCIYSGGQTLEIPTGATGGFIPGQLCPDPYIDPSGAEFPLIDWSDSVDVVTPFPIENVTNWMNLILGAVAIVSLLKRR